MSDERRPTRTWVPLAIAAGIAVLVILAALIFTTLTQRLTATEQEAARECEAAFAASGPSAEITAGDIYVSADWRELEAFLSEHEFVSDSPDPEAMDAAAAALADSEGDMVEVVWWLSDETHLACTVEVWSGVAVPETVKVGDPVRLPLVPAEG